MKRAVTMMLIATLSFGIISGCGNSKQQTQPVAETAQTDAETAQPDTSTDSAKTTEIASFEDVLINYTVKDLDLNDVALSDYVKDNKLTMINFWGTFCGPCISEMPALGEIERRYKDKGFEIVGLTTDVADLDGNYSESTIEDARSIIEDTGITYPVLVAPAQLMVDIGLQYVPTTYFLDSEGNVLGSAEIGSKTSTEWEDVINGYLTME
ncbi:MAG: TlpA family protein disulfide reductase [Butyrivibrio sp.]|nr:TlpA family protein disulfide reductase [Butyrivibrio sp.]